MFGMGHRKCHTHPIARQNHDWNTMKQPMDVQAAFDLLQAEIQKIGKTTLVLLSFQKMTLRSLIDLDLFTADQLVTALKTLQDNQTDDFSKEVIKGLIQSFSVTHPDPPAAEQWPRLVFAQPDASPQKKT
jgi:ABC-type transporter MlaC component